MGKIVNYRAVGRNLLTAGQLTLHIAYKQRLSVSPLKNQTDRNPIGVCVQVLGTELATFSPEARHAHGKGQQRLGIIRQQFK